MKWIAEIILLLGMASIAYGAYRMWEPLGWVVVGVFLCVYAVAAHSAWKEKK